MSQNCAIDSFATASSLSLCCPCSRVVIRTHNNLFQHIHYQLFMKKHQLLCLISFVCITVCAYAANPPVLVSPADRSTVNLSTPFVVTARANDASARTLSVKILLNEPRQQVFEAAQPLNSTQTNTPFDFSVPNNLLLSGKQYLIELKTTNASHQLVGQRYFTFFTTGQATAALPKLLDPAEGAKWYLCENERLVSSYNLKVNANNPQARRILIDVFNKNTGNHISSIPGFPGILLADAQAAVSDQRLSILIDEKTMDEFDALIKVETQDAAGTTLAKREFTIPTKIFRLNRILTPTFTIGAFNVSTHPTITLTTPTEPAESGCQRTVEYVSYELDRAPADLQGPDYIKEMVSSNTNSWTPPVELQPGTTYEVRVTYRTLVYPNGFTERTIAATFTTAAPVSVGPALIQPAANSSLDLCPRFFGNYQTVFNANDTLARKLTYKLFLNDPRQLLQEYTTTFANSMGATQNVSIPISGLIKPKQQYLIELTTADAAGHLLQQKYFTFFTSDKNSENPFPQLVSPTDSAADVSLQPTLQVKPFPSTACGSGIESVYFAIDRYPADWQEEDFQAITFAGGVYSWKVPDTLLANTTYQVRVAFRAPGAVSSLTDLISEFSFTTTGSAPTQPILIEPTATRLEYICPYDRFVGIVVNANDTRARSVSVTFKNKDTGGIVVGNIAPLVCKNAEEALQNMSSYMDVSQLNPYLQGYTEREYFIDVQVFDSAGATISSRTVPFVVKKALPQAPQFMYPTNNASLASTEANIRIGEWPGDMGCVGLGAVQYELDTYPADWQGPDYISRTVRRSYGPDSLYQWSLEGLLPNTKYQVRASFINTALPIPTQSEITFTTGASSARVAAAASRELESQSVVSPNPFTDETSIQLHNGYQKVTVTVISQQGQILLTKESKGGESVSFKASGLHSGLYLVRISEGNQLKEQFKVIKR